MNPHRAGMDSREIAIRIVKGLDAARRASSYENPVDEVGLIEAGIADALDYAAFEIRARDIEIKMLKDTYERDKGSRKNLAIKKEKAKELIAGGMTYREAAKALGFKSPSVIHRYINGG